MMVADAQHTGAAVNLKDSGAVLIKHGQGILYRDCFGGTCSTSISLDLPGIRAVDLMHMCLCLEVLYFCRYT